MTTFRGLVSWLLPGQTSAVGPLPCCSVRTSSLEQSRVVNQTEYWLKYWYNDASEEEEEDEEDQVTYWTPPEGYDQMMDSMDMCPINGLPNISVEKVPVLSKAPNGRQNGCQGLLLGAMRGSIDIMVSPITNKPTVVADPEPLV